MRILADECVYRPVVERLREEGYDVSWIKEDCPGLDDEAVLVLAFGDDRIVLTLDYDFGELAVRLGKPCRGVVIVAAARMALPLAQISDRVASALQEVAGDCENMMTIIEPSRIRQRPLPASSPNDL